MDLAARIFLWIAAVAGGLGTLAGFVLSYMLIRWGYSSDRGWGVAMAVFAIAQNGLPQWGFWLLKNQHPIGALAVGVVWGLISILFLVAWPVLVSAAGQP